MTDESNKNDEPSDAQKLKWLQEFVSDSLKQTAGNPPSGNNVNNGNLPPDIFAQMLAELQFMHAEMIKPTEMKEMNPELRVYVKGVDTQLRYMTSYIKQRIDDHTMRLYLPPKAVGPQGFQQTVYPSIVLYMSMDEFNASIKGSFVVDLRKYCSPPLSPAEQAAQKKFGKVGTEQQDGTIYAGISPDTARPMFAEPVDEGRGLKYSFNAAGRRANKRTRKTGYNYRVPSERELQELYYQRHRVGGFANHPLFADSSYWSSTNDVSPTIGVSVNFREGYGGGSTSSKLRKYKVRLIHD